jgi:hypothetical protein
MKETESHKSKLCRLIENIQEIPLEEIISFFERTDDILILKFDGVRDNNKYSVIILGKESRFDTIRFDGSNIKECLKRALGAYLKVVEC